MENKEKKDEILCPECGEPLSTHGEEFKTKEEFIDHLANAYTDSVFEEFWSDKKNELKHLSKREIAEEAFFQSIANFLHNFIPDRSAHENDVPQETVRG